MLYNTVYYNSDSKWEKIPTQYSFHQVVSRNELAHPFYISPFDFYKGTYSFSMANEFPGQRLHQDYSEPSHSRKVGSQIQKSELDESALSSGTTSPSSISAQLVLVCPRLRSAPIRKKRKAVERGYILTILFY
jgi:hypothetical protein